MKLYIYNVNYKNEFLSEIEVTELELKNWLGVSTDIEPAKSLLPGKSYAFNKLTNAWDILIDDWRGTTFYNVTNSTMTVKGKLLPMPIGYTTVVPPDNLYIYKFIDNVWVKQPIITKNELIEELYTKKCLVAYTGLTIIKDGESYLFETSQDSITMCNSTAIAYSTMPDETIINWKVWSNNEPKFIEITKAQFTKVFAFGMQMINSAFTVEALQNAIVIAMTTENLTDLTFINNFRVSSDQAFAAVVKEFSIDALNA